MGYFCCSGTEVIGGGTCGGAAMLKISSICFKAFACFPPRVVSGLVEFGLKRAFIRSSAACVAMSSDEILGNGGVLGRNIWCMRRAPMLS